MSDSSSTSNFPKNKNNSVSLNSISSSHASNNSENSLSKPDSSQSHSSPFINQTPNSFTSSQVNASNVSKNLKATINSNNYLDKISSNSNRANDYFHRIDSISSNMAENSAGISSAFAKMNLLNEQTGVNEITLSDNQAVNNANQLVAVNMIRGNNQKIKALTAKNKISSMSFMIKLDYKNYLKAQKAIKNDVTGINTHMTSNAVFNRGINTLNSHNSLITSYANRLSTDISSADQEVSNASLAANATSKYASSASSAYYQVSSLVNHFQQRIINGARSNAEFINKLASEAANTFSDAQDYNQQVHNIANSYSDNSAISSASNLVSVVLKKISTNHVYLSHVASSAVNQLKQITPNNVDSLGDDYRSISSAANSTSSYRNIINSANHQITSATSAANSIADQLYAEQIALHDGANAYEPVASMPSLNTSSNTPTYIKYYKHGYQKAHQGFEDYVDNFVVNKPPHQNSQNSSYQIGFKNANYFIKGVNDSRKRIIKNNELVNSKHYNFGYNTYRKLINNNLFPGHKGFSLPLNQSLVLVLGFLIGYNS